MMEGKLSPTDEQMRDWRSTLIKVMVESDDKSTRFDLAEILTGILSSKD